MKDDFTNLETGSQCYVLNNATTIYSYKGGVRKTYIQVGGKWIYNAQATYNTIPNNTVCISYNDITSLNSNSQFYPIYLMIAFELGICVWFLWFSVFRRLFRWSIR